MESGQSVLSGAEEGAVLQYGSPRLCDVCNAIFSLDVIPACRHRHDIQHHHRNSSSLEKATSAGCYICAVFWQPDSGIISTGFQVLESKRTTSKSTPNYLCLMFWIWQGGDDTRYEPLHASWAQFGSFDLMPAHTATAMGLQAGLPRSTRSTETFLRARRWIQDCLNNHVHCDKNEPQIQLPTRLVYVQEGLNGLSARLCSGNSLPNNTQYLTLSHCWGEERFLTLTSENKRSFETSIPVGSLTKTFQDALYLTMKLGYEYIWVDSLCIIQEDINNADWEVEAARMCNVYKNATCNIAASGAPDGSAGLFADRNSQFFEPVKVHAKWPSAHIDCASNSEYVLYREHEYWTGMHGGPLLERAWVFQEQLLARRTLFFGAEQLFWECHELTGSEVWPYGVQRELISEHLPPRLIDTFRNQKPHLDQAVLYSNWMQLIREYSNRRLSYPSDRLPAIQGIAAEYQTKVEDMYLAGLWLGDLVRSMVWISLPEEDGQPDLLRAPSWSWASLDGGVFFACEGLWPHSLLGCLISVAPNMHVELSAPLSLLPLKTASFVFAHGSRDAFTMTDQDNNLKWRFSMDQWCMKPLHQVHSEMTTTGLPKGFKISAGTIGFNELKYCMKDVVLIHLFSHICSVEGLMIAPIPGEARRMFRRIGAFRVTRPHRNSDEPFWNESGTLGNLELYLDLIWADTDCRSPEDYTGRDQKGNSTISLM